MVVLILLAVLVLIATMFHLLLAGSGVVRLGVQLPARRTLDPVDLAHYFRATDMGNGFLLYPLLGAGGPAATWAALAVAVTSDATGDATLLLGVASVLAAAHAFTTARAAPVMLRIGRSEDRAEVLAPLIERFVWWSWPRAVLQALTAVALVAAVLLIWSPPPIPSWILALVLSALALASVLAGAGLDQIVVHLPARKKLGDAAYVAYLRSADLASGRRLYAAAGVGNAVVLVVLSVTLLATAASLTAILAMGAMLCGLSALYVTRRSLPIAKRLASADSGSTLTSDLDRFVESARMRALFHLGALACVVGVLLIA